MAASLIAAALLNLACALAPSWEALLATRALEGIAFSGLPAVAMAYLSEEMERRSIGLAVGLYIAGSALGGMLGRFVSGFLADVASWRWALAAIGIASAAVFWRTLPPSRHFHPRPLALGQIKASFAGSSQRRRPAQLFIEGFLIMGSFVTTYN